MITRLFSLVLVALMGLSANADLLFTNFTTGSSGYIGVEKLATVVQFGVPGDYDVKSIDAKLAFTGGTHSNVSALVTLFTNPNMNNTTSVFQNQAAQATFQLGNVFVGAGPGNGSIRTFNFDFAAQNLVTRFTDNMGIEIRLFENGQVVGTNGFGMSNVGGNSKTFFDDDSNGLYSASERGMLSQSLENQLQVNGFSVTAVPEPSSLIMLGLSAMLYGVRRRYFA